MKRSNLISVIALVISVVAFSFALHTQSKLDEKSINLAAEKALKKREKELIEKFRDHFSKMYKGQDLGITENWNPQNLEELFAPAIKTINALEE